MAYVIQNGDSGYTRAAFESALVGKQNVLQSGVNIKTVDGKSVLGSGDLQIEAQTYEYDLSELETALKNATHDKLFTTQYPIGPNGSNRVINPNGKFFMFGVVSDLHHCVKKLSEGDTIYDVYSSEGQYVTSKPSIKLLGAIAYDSDIDIVVSCGDMSSGGNQTREYYYNTSLAEVKRLFTEYIPCPYFICDGNHDRGLTEDAGKDKLTSNEEWLTFVSQFSDTMGKNIDVRRVQDDIEDGLTYGDGAVLPTGKTSASYYVDINDKKIRIGFLSDFEVSVKDANNSENSVMEWGVHYLSAHAVTRMGTKDCRDWTIIVVSHHDTGSNVISRILAHYFAGKPIESRTGSSAGGHDYDSPNGGAKGKCVAAWIRGHTHVDAAGVSTPSASWYDNSVNYRFESYTIPSITMGRTFALSRNKAITGGYIPYEVDKQPLPEDDKPVGASAYGFSIFVIDTDEWWLYEIRVGRQDRKNDIEIGSGTNYKKLSADEYNSVYCYKLSHT